MSEMRKRYQVSVGWFEVRNVWIEAADSDDAIAQAEQDWSGMRALDWYEYAVFEPPLFQVEDSEDLDAKHEPF